MIHLDENLELFFIKFVAKLLNAIYIRSFIKHLAIFEDMKIAWIVFFL